MSQVQENQRLTQSNSSKASSENTTPLSLRNFSDNEREVGISLSQKEAELLGLTENEKLYDWEKFVRQNYFSWPDTNSNVDSSSDLSGSNEKGSQQFSRYFHSQETQQGISTDYLSETPTKRLKLSDSPNSNQLFTQSCESSQDSFQPNNSLDFLRPLQMLSHLQQTYPSTLFIQPSNKQIQYLTKDELQATYDFYFQDQTDMEGQFSLWVCGNDLYGARFDQRATYQDKDSMQKVVKLLEQGQEIQIARWNRRPPKLIERDESE
ncbi:hypothetical protein FGO68_gene5039 [Halteria grandinella]|uniref:Uncharacterized protein n=1 Tax=Halteria grandinella TaxID=5974 RepID=A0A8J8P7W8_HALGN|nr:hypothetical protein FGO68_gene5039 [Halteria grandinella]